MIKVDFHTHTFFSYDCNMRPVKILELAKKRGITHIVINDHNTIAGGLACKAIEKHFDIEVIVGSEIKTDIGDVTGIYLKEEIKPGPYLEVIKQIRAQGGLSILNHPMVGHQLENVDFSVFDFIEGYNGRCNMEQNFKAMELANTNHKPIVAGSDAHTYAEVGKNYSEFEKISDLFNAKGHYYQKSHPYHKLYSQFVKGIKKKDLLLLAKVVLSAPKKLLLNR